MADLYSSIRDFLARNLGLKHAEIDSETPLFSSGLLDSFAMVELVAFVESHASVKVRARDVTLDNFDSIERIQKFVARART